MLEYKAETKVWTSPSERAARIMEIAAELADLFAERAPRHEANGTFPYENYDDVRRTGYHLLTVPESYGGWGATLGEVVRAQARLGEGDASTALVMSMQLTQVARAIESGAWPQPALEKLLRGVVEEGALFNSAASEPSTGSPSRGGVPSTTAKRTANGWLINGRKTYTTGSPVLTFFLISAQIIEENANPDDKPKVAQFLVRRDLPGVSVVPTWNSMAMKLSGSNDLILDNVALATDDYVGNPKGAPEVAARLNFWTLPVSALYFGVGRAAAKYAVNFARNRKPNSLNKPIAELEHIQEKVGRMEMALLSAEQVLFDTADMHGNQHLSGAEIQARVAASKYLATNKAIEAVDLAMRIVGAAGLSMNEPLQRYYRDVRAGLNNPPMDDVALLTVGKWSLGLL